MDEPLMSDLVYIFAFCLAGLAFALGPFVVVHLLSTRGTRQTANKTQQAIECGMDPIGDAWIRYSAVYYLYALVFVAFAVDVLFLIPVALVYNDPQICDPGLRRDAHFCGDSLAGDRVCLEERSFRMEAQEDIDPTRKGLLADRQVRDAGRAAGAWAAPTRCGR